MKTVLIRIAVILLGLAAGQPAIAQTYVDNLNGTHANSTLDANVTAPLPALGWTGLSGTPRVFNSDNDAIINGNAASHAPFSVQYLTSATLVANSTYTLSFRMGYFSTNSNGQANYEFSLGTWDGSDFDPLQTASGGPVAYNGQFSMDGSFGVTASLNYSTGSTVSSDVIAVRWAQPNTPAAGTADFMGFDNVMLSYSAIPEPSTYAAVLGAIALGGVFIARRRRSHPPARR